MGGIVIRGGGGGGGGGAGGLFSPIMSPLPTEANTGFSSWYYQFTGTTVVDSELGVAIKAAHGGASNRWNARMRAVPATPYSIRMLLSGDVDPQYADGSVIVGWADGANTKSAGWMWTLNYTGTNGHIFANPTGSTNTSVTPGGGGPHLYGRSRCWIRMTDDGTTAKIFMSRSGDTNSFHAVYSATKSGSYLGAGGYTNLIFGYNSYQSVGTTILQSFEIE